MSEFPTVASIAADVRAGRASARTVLDSHLARIDARESEVHAFNLVMRDHAAASAASIDDRVKRETIPADSPEYRSR